MRGVDVQPRIAHDVSLPVFGCCPDGCQPYVYAQPTVSVCHGLAKPAGTAYRPGLFYSALVQCRRVFGSILQVLLVCLCKVMGS